MHRLLWLILALLPTLATAQEAAVPRAKGTITVDTAPTGSCDSAAYSRQFRKVKATGEEFACVGGSWALISSPTKNVAGGTVKTVGPATDVNGDGTVASGEGRFDYNAPSFGGGVYGGGAVIEAAIAAGTPSASSPLEILVYPGHYDLSDAADTNADITKSYITIRAASPHTAVLSNGTTGYSFTISSSVTNITIDGFVLEHPISGGGPGSRYAKYWIRNNRFSSTGSTSGDGFLFLHGDDQAPGPFWYVDNNTCLASHFCIDLWGVYDNDSDGTTEFYNNVVSHGNHYEVNGYYVMPVDLIGPNVNFWSSGDSYFADCYALNIGDYFSASIPTTPRIVEVSGATFYVGPPTNSDSRATCPQGPFPLTLSQTNVAVDSTLDRATDNISISGSSFYVGSQVGEPRHGILLHRGRAAVVRMIGNTYMTDTGTNYVPYYFTQAGSYTPRVFSGGGDIQYVSEDVYSNHVKGWGLSSTGEFSTRTLSSPSNLWITTSLVDASPRVNWDIDHDGSPEALFTTSDLDISPAVDSIPFSILARSVRLGEVLGSNGAALEVTTDGLSNTLNLRIVDYTGFSTVDANFGDASYRWKVFATTVDVSEVLKLAPTDSPPTCNAGAKGTIYYDDSLGELCDCNGSAWAQVDGGGGC